MTRNRPMTESEFGNHVRDALRRGSAGHALWERYRRLSRESHVSISELIRCAMRRLLQDLERHELVTVLNDEDRDQGRNGEARP